MNDEFSALNDPYKLPPPSFSKCMMYFDTGRSFDDDLNPSSAQAKFDLSIPPSDNAGLGTDPLMDRYKTVVAEKFKKLGYELDSIGYVPDRSNWERDERDFTKSYQLYIDVKNISDGDLYEVQKKVLKEIAADENEKPHPSALLSMPFGSFLKKNGVELVSHQEADIASHISRHTAATLDIGSKFLLNKIDTYRILDDGQEQLGEKFRSQIEDTGKIGRVVFETTHKNPVGQDALVDLSKYSSGQVFELVRDAGDPKAEARVKVVIANVDDIPLTNKITFIGGPYGPTGKAGFYTAFPGDPGEPFSKTEYWKTHGFLATPAQVKETIQQMLAKADEVAPTVATQSEIAKMAERAEAMLDAFGFSSSHTRQAANKNVITSDDVIRKQQQPPQQPAPQITQEPSTLTTTLKRFGKMFGGG